MAKKQFLLDTNVLMSTENYEKLFKDFEDAELIIHPDVIEELDNIKIREGAPGYQARRAIKAIKKYAHNFTFVKACLNEDKKVDNRLIGYACENNFHLLTNDTNMQLKAERVSSFPIECERYNQSKKTVGSGYKEITDIAELDTLELHRGGYAILNEETGFKSLGEGLFEEIKVQPISSKILGYLKPYDIYQACAINSLIEDDFSIITGTAGTGKTLISLSYAIREVHCGKRDKLIIFANPVKTKGAEQLGFYSGDRTEKLIQNSIGAILSSKLGGMEGVLELMEKGLLEILPISDIRGYEVGQNNIMYITEAQNLNVELVKLAIQRCAEGAKIILEGDPTTQVDHYSFEGEGNGLVRAIEVFEGFESFSHVNLPNIYRSEIANWAEKM